MSSRLRLLAPVAGSTYGAVQVVSLVVEWATRTSRPPAVFSVV